MLADCPHIHCPKLVFTVMFLFFKNRPVILWPSKICLYSVTFLRLNRCHLMYSMSTLHSGVSDSSSAFLDHNSTKQTLLYPSNHPG